MQRRRHAQMRLQLSDERLPKSDAPSVSQTASTADSSMRHMGVQTAHEPELFASADAQLAPARTPNWPHAPPSAHAPEAVNTSKQLFDLPV